MGNYHNRSIEQIHSIDDVSSDGDNLVESAILWLEVINSNLNELMGLVSVNNYLLGMMGAGSVGQSGESIDEVRKMIEESNSPTFTGYASDTLELGALTTAIASLLFKANPTTALVSAIATMSLYSLIYVFENVVPDAYWLEKEEELNKMSPYLTPKEYYKRSGGESWDNLSEDEKKDIESKTENYNRVYPYGNYDGASIEFNDIGLPVKLLIANDNVTTQCFEPLSEVCQSRDSNSAFQMLAVQDNGLQTTPMQDMYKYFDFNSVNDIAFGRLFETVALDNYSNMLEQGNGSTKKAFSDAVESCNIFIEVMDKIPAEDLVEIYNTVNSLNLDNNSNQYAKPMVYSYADENKTSQMTSEDIRNYMHNLNNVIPPTVENTYEIQVTNNFDMKITKDVDYEDILKYVADSLTDVLYRGAVFNGVYFKS